MTYNIHFGMFSGVDSDKPLETIRLAGHNDPSTEVEVDLPAVMSDSGIKIFISGSWDCWGPADQETDGDGYSLHVLVQTPELSAKHVSDLRSFVEFGLPDEDSGQCSLLDYCYVTTDDWSEITHVVLFGGKPWCVLYEAGKVVDTYNHRAMPIVDPDSPQSTLKAKRDHQIAEYGHQVRFIFPTPESIEDGSLEYPFWYSVGRHAHGKPELLATGPLQPEVGHWLINHAAAMYDEGRLALGEQDDVLADGQKVRIVEVDPAASQMLGSINYAIESALEKGETPQPVVAWQILWPDVEGRYPDDPNFANGDYGQPFHPKETP